MQDGTLRANVTYKIVAKERKKCIHKSHSERHTVITYRQDEEI
jgi:hypothetical protein